MRTILKSSEIRQAYLNFFKEKGHKIIPSSSLVPHGDPTLLLTTAGMVQIKPYFLGLAVPPSVRLASCQKCFRTTDVDAVGDAKHLTFFEMLGNFSVGDYFKKEAIAWAWEFVNQHLKIDRDRLWITVYLDDDESFAYWKALGVDENKIVRLGEKDNFWGPPGDSGPCGPCSELHYDFGESYGCGNPDCKPGCSCGRFTEIWNLVFTQFNQDKEGKRTPLPKPNIDTGMGLERTAAVMQNVYSVYDTDLFLTLREYVCALTGKKYGSDGSSDQAIRIICEHSRGLTFLISDGVLPSNDGRGYVLRRLLRRASFFGRKIGMRKPFVGSICGKVIDQMGLAYPELNSNRDFILEVVKSEEEKFIDTLDAGMSLVEKTIADLLNKGSKKIEGKEIFRLYDTYGFPAELTHEIAREKGLSVDLKGFEIEMSKQREKARSGQKFSSAASSNCTSTPILNTRFIGYEQIKGTSRVSYISDQDTGSPLDSAGEGKNVAIVLDETPFYGEKGGQVGDIGILRVNSSEVKVMNTLCSPFQSIPEGVVVHLGQVIKGKLSIGDKVEAEVDIERRKSVERNHTATHLLQSALRQVLGQHVTQRGSLVEPERLRFDYSHLTALDKKQIREIQSIVNNRILQNLPVISLDNIPFRQAVEEGALALFEEKYGDRVRMLKIGKENFVSVELCGGTHVRFTGEIGLFLITSESSIGTGLRRIEAVTGGKAQSFVEEQLEHLKMVADELNVSTSETPAKVKILMSELATERKHTIAVERKMSMNMLDDLVNNATEVNGIKVVSAHITSSSIPILRELGDSLRQTLKSAVIVLATTQDDKPAFIALVTPDLVKKGFRAGEIIKQVAEITGGSGGGKPEIAQAGGKDKNKIEEALASVTKLVEKIQQ